MKKFWGVVLWFACARALAATAPFTVEDIKVEGVQRTSPGTVFNYLPVKVGDTLDDEKAKASVQALFKTGFYNDVRLERKGNVLVVHVVERPSIDSIKIEGASEFEDDTLKKTLKEMGLAEGRIFNRSLLDRIEQELKRQYFARGNYAVKIKTTVSPLERNRVAVAIDVSEGPVAKIRQINLVGNKVFDDETLLKQFTLSTPTLFSFITKNDQYSKQKLSADLENLRSFYQNRGYIEFAIDSTQVSISPDKESIYVTINVREGQRYTVADYKLLGKLILPEAQLRALVGIKPGDVFSRKAVTEATKRMTDRLGNEGYAFAGVNVSPELDKQKRTASLTFFVDPGHRVYVRRIGFSGNTNTRDAVLRREMRQMEGALYSAEKIQRSVARLRKLGFFDEVTVDTPPVPGSPDQVDVNVTVKERETGNLMAGVGYSDVEGVVLNASISLKNLVGTGKELTANVDTSESNKNLNLTYVNPYWTQTGISRGFNVFYNRYNAGRATNAAAYDTETAGAGTFFTVPIAEERSVNFGLAFESVKFDVNSETSQIAQDFVARNGERNDIVRGNFGWAYDTLDTIYFPSKGLLQKANAEVGLPGLDLEYYKLTYLAAAYFPTSAHTTLRLRGELGYGDGYGGTEELPFFKNFYAGGAQTVRGYNARSLGPKDLRYPDRAVGGSSRVLGNVEWFFPFPGQEADNQTMRLSLFADAGMVYGPSESIDVGDLRYAAGVAFNWFTPIAPLSLSWGTPLNAKPSDDIERFQFTLGTTFR